MDKMSDNIKLSKERQQNAGVDESRQPDLGGAIVAFENRVLDDDLVPQMTT